MIRHLKLTHGDRLTVGEGEAIVRAIEYQSLTARGPATMMALAKIRRALADVPRRREESARRAADKRARESAKRDREALADARGV